MEALKDYDYFLPEGLIATVALADRGSSRLLRLGRSDNAPIDDLFKNIGSYLCPGDVLVVNNTKVMKARIKAYKKSGGLVEILLVKPLDNGSFTALINGRGPFLPGTKLDIDGAEILVTGKSTDEPGLYELAAPIDLALYAKRHGELPLPPYFGRKARAEDEISYQTVYACADSWGAVAAPTAGLHFTNTLLAHLKEQGIKVVETTLHVGPGTFLPIRVENISEHAMHKEWFSLSEDAAKILNQAKSEKKRIIAVGTTALRVLEQVRQWAEQKEEKDFFACSGITALFIRPGFKFLGADGLITNFHLPRSTLLVLVAAAIGLKRALMCYEHAIKERYRFYSYGDACFFDIGGRPYE
ncbi:MAG TPA: tRNA preQ1(34) S-adenosylmethionine ribosyltransferase-isomerase QueA [Myxococcota bacterium]|nr:tRNA preQ1(34) S-adenosylmethionine ribosyltransferase-isomerase QueA [Myxococcota bacterium]